MYIAESSMVEYRVHDHSGERIVKRIVVIMLFIPGCAATHGLREMRAAIDDSPLGCGYKWFQSGHAALSCDEYARSSDTEKTALARADAWEIARERCPASCPPVELTDSTANDGPRSQTGCRGSVAYYPSRVFFQCGPD